MPITIIWVNLFQYMAIVENFLIKTRAIIIMEKNLFILFIIPIDCLLKGKEVLENGLLQLIELK